MITESMYDIQNFQIFFSIKDFSRSNPPRRLLGCNWFFLKGIHGIKRRFMCGMEKNGMINKMR